jgi:hypothetical protein
MAAENTWTKRIPTAIAFLAILAFFLYFAHDAVHARFSSDDPMNLGGYWKRGLWPTIADNLRFWSSAYRPMGGLYYLPLYRMFGLNPLPYHIVALAFVFAGIWLSYLVAMLLTKSRAIALVTGIICCAHAEMPDVYYGANTIYDILARFFCLLTLLLYIRIRDRGEVPNLRQAFFILAAFAAALDSKEISIIAAASVLSYEVIFHGWPRHWTWLRREGLVPTLMIIFGLAYMAGKILGPGSLSSMDSYRLAFSLDRYLDNNVSYTTRFFYQFLFDSRGGLIAVDIALCLLLGHDRPAVRWSAFYVLTATFPISFIPGRGGSNLLLPFFGWALLLSTLIASAWTPSWKYSKWAIRTSLALFCLLFMAITVTYWRFNPPVIARTQAKTWDTITQLNNLHFQPKPGSKVIIVNDPWEKDWDMAFIAELVWNDPSVEITLSRKLDAPPDLSRFDSVLEFGSDGVLRKVR